jgi:hypothetical protein
LLVTVGVAGVAFTTTATVPAAVEPQPGTVAITEYVPVAAVLTFVIDGFCVVEVKPLGPVQLYVAAVSVFVVRVKVCPEHTGLLDEGVGVVGGGLMVTNVVLFELVQPATVTLTV